MPDSTPDPTIAAPTLTPGAYLRRCREARGFTLDDLALFTETIPAYCARERAEWLRTIEADIAPISVGTGVVLHQLLDFDPQVLDALIELHAIELEGARTRPVAAPVQPGPEVVAPTRANPILRLAGGRAAA